MAKKMKLDLYKNLDPDQPLVITGSCEDVIVGKLKTWMNDNNGENGKPCGVDGLTVVIQDQFEPYEVTLAWTECYKDWEISWGDDVDTTSFPKWHKARDAFVDAAFYEIWFDNGED